MDYRSIIAQRINAMPSLESMSLEELQDFAHYLSDKITNNDSMYKEWNNAIKQHNKGQMGYEQVGFDNLLTRLRYILKKNFKTLSLPQPPLYGDQEEQKELDEILKHQEASMKCNQCGYEAKTNSDGVCEACSTKTSKASYRKLIKEADATMKSMFDGIMQAINEGHMEPSKAASLREKMQEALMNWMADERTQSPSPMNNVEAYRKLIYKKALRSKINLNGCGDVLFEAEIELNAKQDF